MPYDPNDPGDAGARSQETRRKRRHWFRPLPQPDTISSPARCPAPWFVPIV